MRYTRQSLRVCRSDKTENFYPRYNLFLHGTASSIAAWLGVAPLYMKLHQHDIKAHPPGGGAPEQSYRRLRPTKPFANANWPPEFNTPSMVRERHTLLGHAYKIFVNTGIKTEMGRGRRVPVSTSGGGGGGGFWKRYINHH